MWVIKFLFLLFSVVLTLNIVQAVIETMLTYKKNKE